VKLKVTFNNIFVNSDYYLVEGNIPVVTDYSNNAIWDADQLTEGHNTKPSGQGEKADIVTDYVIPGADSFHKDADGNIVVTDAAGNEHILIDNGQLTVDNEDGQPSPLGGDGGGLIVQDSAGNLYSVNTSTGQATAIGNSSKIPLNQQTRQLPFDQTEIASDRAVAIFEPAKESKYAFDVYNKIYAASSLMTEKYEELKVVQGEAYKVPFKLIPEGATDVVRVTLTHTPADPQRDPALPSKAIDPAKVTFISAKGTEYKATIQSGSDNTKTIYELTLPAAKANDGYELFAIHLSTAPNANGNTHDMIGKLTVISYSVKTPKLILVPVNGNEINTTEVKEYLDRVYKPIGVNWQVSKSDDFNYNMPTDSLDVVGSGMFSQYTHAMKAMNAEFMQRDDYDPSAVHLFVLNYASTSGVSGDMPRNKQFGYIFMGAVNDLNKTVMSKSDIIGRTIAHEVGHGVFHLKHTFDNDYRITESTTDNLMDYNWGTSLIKHQWDGIHDPGLVIGMFERDEDAMMSTTIQYIIKDKFYTDLGCSAPSNPFDNRKEDGKTISNLLGNIFYEYKTGQKYSKTKFKKLSNKNMIIGELQLWFSSEIFGNSDRSSYCINDMYISLIDNTKEEIDLTKRTISGNNSEAYLTIDNTIRITLQEDKGEYSKIVAEHINKAFSLLNKDYFDNSYSGGFAVREDNLNENQMNAIKYFLDTQEGYDFVKLFAKKGDVVMGKEFDKDGKIYETYKIGLIINSKPNNGDSDSDFSTNGITGKSEKKEKNHFTVGLTKTGFGTGIEDIDVLEALLHECFLHGYTYVDDLMDDNEINNNNLNENIREYKPHSQHYHFTQIIAIFKGKYFKDLPQNGILYDNKGNRIIGLEHWPIKAFDILKRYANGRVSDYKLQHIIMDFKGSQISISEQTGKIEDKK
jgi:hypothetical protein